MANSASDARASEQEIRRQLIESRAVDAIVAVGPNMFYTVTLPCTLWFFDKGKADTPRADTVLFLDARHIYRQVDRAHRDWTTMQIGFLANIVRLYRGEALDFTLGGDESREKIEETFGDKIVDFKKPSASSSTANRKLKVAEEPAGYGKSKSRYRDIPGLCKAAPIEDIEAQGWSLNPGRYVGVVPGEEVSDENFKAQLEALNEELETLNAQAHQLEETIATNVTEILGPNDGAG
jgi:type I restriction enzyme M protein